MLVISTPETEVEAKAPSVESSLDKIRKSSVLWFVGFAIVAAGQWYQVQGFVTAQTIINIDQKAANQKAEEANRQRDMQIIQNAEQIKAMKEQMEERTDSLRAGMEALDRRVSSVEGRQ